MNQKKWLIALLILVPVAFGTALFARWQFGTVADPERAEPGLSVSPLAKQLRALDSVRTELARAPEVAPLTDSASGRNRSTDWPFPSLPYVAKSESPPDSATKPGFSFSVLPIRLVPGISVPYQPVPGTVRPPWQPPVTSLWALAPVLGAATFVTRADVSAAVVPEPGTLGLLSFGIALLVPLAIIRRRRARRADSGTDGPAD